MPEELRDQLHKAVQTLNSGGTLLYPTDTLWGLGCDATDGSAVAKISALKGRSAAKSFVCLVPNDGMLQRLVPDIPEVAWELLDATTTPLTLVLPNVKGLAAEALAPDGSGAFRIVRDGVCNRLLTAFGKPLISSSANISGEAFPRKQFEIDPRILNGVDYALILQPEPAMTSKPSAIIKLGAGGEVEVIRN